MQILTSQKIVGTPSPWWRHQSSDLPPKAGVGDNTILYHREPKARFLLGGDPEGVDEARDDAVLRHDLRGGLVEAELPGAQGRVVHQLHVGCAGARLHLTLYMSPKTFFRFKEFSKREQQR